jgi:hypothetical protein
VRKGQGWRKRKRDRDREREQESVNNKASGEITNAFSFGGTYPNHTDFLSFPGCE